MKRITYITAGLFILWGSVVLLKHVYAQTKDQYFIGSIVQLDGQKNELTLNEFNSGKAHVFIFKTGLPRGLSLGDEVVVVAPENNNIATALRYLSHETLDTLSFRGNMSGNRLMNTSRHFDPFEEMDNMQQAMDRIFRQSFRTNVFDGGIFNSSIGYNHDLGIEEKPDKYIVKLDVSGINNSKVEVKVENHILTVSGETDHDEKRTMPQGNLQYRAFGSFLKAVPIPADADENKMETKREGQYLIISLPKKSI